MQYRMFIYGLVFLGSVVFLSEMNSVQARVILKEQTTFYNVKGRTGREIFKSMVDNGPKLGGRRGHALATTEYEYDVRNIDVAIERGRCIPTSLDVTVYVKYTYPRWTPNNAARSTTRKAWDRFLESVIWHEKQHVKIALEYAQDYEKALKKTKLRVSKNCSKASFSSVWRATVAALKHNRKQKQFDRRDLRPGGRGYEAQLNLMRAQ